MGARTEPVVMARLPRVSARAQRSFSPEPIEMEGGTHRDSTTRIQMAMDNPDETVLVAIRSRMELPGGGSRTRHELIADWSPTSPKSRVEALTCAR